MRRVIDTPLPHSRSVERGQLRSGSPPPQPLSPWSAVPWSLFLLTTPLWRRAGRRVFNNYTLQGPRATRTTRDPSARRSCRPPVPCRVPVRQQHGHQPDSGIRTVRPDAHRTVPSSPPAAPGLSLPIGLTFGPNGNLVNGGNQVLEFTGDAGACWHRRFYCGRQRRPRNPRLAWRSAPTRLRRRW